MGRIGQEQKQENFWITQVEKKSKSQGDFGEVMLR